MKFYAQISSSGKIVPLYDTDYDTYRKLRKNVDLQFEVKQPRNYQFHKKFFALVNMVFENQEVYTDIDKLRYDLTIEAGYWEEHADFNGVIHRTAKSISFGSMDETEFSELYNNFCNTVIKIMGWERQEIEENIESFL